MTLRMRQWGRLIVVVAMVGGMIPGLTTPVLAAALSVAMTGTDVGNCTLAACRHIGYAINQASSGATITVAAGLYTESLTIDRALTITGAGAGNTFVDGGQAARVVMVNADVTATINGVTIQNGATVAGDDGGGILNQGTLALANVTVQNNSATPLWSAGDVVTGGRGGGVANTSAGMLTMTATTVTGNTAHTAWNLSGGYIEGSIGGGGIYNAGTLVIQGNSAITNNTAETSPDGGPPGGTQKGGRPGWRGYPERLRGHALHLQHDHQQQFGGVRIRRGDLHPIHWGSNTITIDHSTISGNVAYYYAINVIAPLTITNSTISGNLPYTSGNMLVGGGAINTVQWRLHHSR